MFNAQLITLSYSSTNWLAGLNLNIPLLAREIFRLTDFWTTMYISGFLPCLSYSLYAEALRMTNPRPRAPTKFLKGFITFLLPWRTKLSGLFTFRINSAFENLLESRWDPFGRGSVRRKFVTYAGQQNHRTTEQRQREIFIPLLGFEPTIPTLERTKILHALNRAATVIGRIQTFEVNSELKRPEILIHKIRRK
jgi:hypothetical protein